MPDLFCLRSFVPLPPARIGGTLSAMAFFRPAPRRRTGTPILDPWHLLRRHSDALATAAQGILSAHPDAQLAGLIVTPAAEHGDELRALLAACHGPSDPHMVCVGLVPRTRLAVLLHQDLGGGATALATRTVPQLLLPIVVAAPAGLRVGSVPCGRDAAAGD